MARRGGWDERAECNGNRNVERSGAIDRHPDGYTVITLKRALLLVYVGAVVIAATSVVGLLLQTNPLGLRHPVTSLTFIALLIIGEIFPLRWFQLDEGYEITSSWAFAVALIFIESTLTAALAIAGASICADLYHRKATHKVAFNGAQLALSIAAAGLLLDRTGQREVLTDASRSIDLTWVIVMVAAGLSLLVVNGIMTSTAIVLFGHTSLSELWPKGLISGSPTDAALIALAPSVVVISQRSLLMLPLGMMTALVIHHGARRALRQEHQATHDSLTNLWNRRAFVDRLATVISSSDRTSTCRAVLVLDLDGFKSINDLLGHHIGDQILCEVGERLEALHGPGQMSARLGGDEFATLLVHTKTSEEARQWAQQLHDALAEPYTSIGFPVHLTASIGMAVMDIETDTPAALLQAADIAMYAAKRDSLGVHVRSRHDTGRQLGRLNLISELEGALERGELFVEYQPQASTRTGSVFGFEALLRWQHPTLGLIQPSEFMPLAEQTELMQPITQFVLRRSLTDLARWQSAGWSVRIAANVSAQNLHNPHFPNVVRQALTDTGIAGSALELEITENAVMTKREVIHDVLLDLRNLGARIVIDDFGTGYSSLANMRHLPLDGVKIDRSFIVDLERNHDDFVIVSSIIELARNLHLESTAEGVESATAWQRLAELGCDHIQGFVISRPMAGDKVLEWLQRYQPSAAVHVRAPVPRLQLINGAS